MLDKPSLFRHPKFDALRKRSHAPCSGRNIVRQHAAPRDIQYDITKWDSTTILFRTDTDCVEYVYTVDRSNKRLFGTRTKKTNTGSDCTMVEDKPLRLTLVDGFDVWKNINQEVEAKYVPFVWLTVAAWWLLPDLIIFRRRRQSLLAKS